MSLTTTTITRAQYEAAFAQECVQTYPVVDAIEARCGVAVDRARLEAAARVLACPVKPHPPNWQHGRVLYALTRHYLLAATAPVQVLDIGTAKGFSALCLLWALQDAGVSGLVTSIDVLDPHSAVPRNTIADCDGVKTLAQILQPWPESDAIYFVHGTGRQWLTTHPERVHVAFVDGKHSYEAVSWEGALLTERQRTGDLAIFDDVQVPAVERAVRELTGYEVEDVDLLPHRRYTIGRRRG